MASAIPISMYPEALRTAREKSLEHPVDSQAGTPVWPSAEEARGEKGRPVSRRECNRAEISCCIEDSMVLIGIFDDRASGENRPTRFAALRLLGDDLGVEDVQKELWKFNRPASREQTKMAGPGLCERAETAGLSRPSIDET
jgi:hypothetical protein